MLATTGTPHGTCSGRHGRRQSESGTSGYSTSLLNRTQALQKSEHALAPRSQLLPGKLPNKTGGCASKPDTEEGRFNSSSSASSSTNSPARPSTSVFEYRTAELSEANVDGICVGLTAEWLLNLNNGASNRMAALRPGSESHASAGMRQQQYQDLKDSLRRQGARSAQADFQAQNTMLQEAGLAPSGKEKISIRRAFKLLAHAGQDHCGWIDAFAQPLLRRRWRTHGRDASVEWHDHAL